MEYRKLGNTDLDVSLICLGTMTWGQQNTEAEGHEQMDYALERGINFFDTAEMYSIPPSPHPHFFMHRTILEENLRCSVNKYRNRLVLDSFILDLLITRAVDCSLFPCLES